MGCVWVRCGGGWGMGVGAPRRCRRSRVVLPLDTQQQRQDHRAPQRGGAPGETQRRPVDAASSAVAADAASAVAAAARAGTSPKERSAKEHAAQQAASSPAREGGEMQPDDGRSLDRGAGRNREHGGCLSRRPLLRRQERCHWRKAATRYNPHRKTTSMGEEKENSKREVLDARFGDTLSDTLSGAKP